jgi:hypothetical protein
VADGLVLAGISFHLGVIQGHVPQAHHAGLLAQLQNLNKQTLERIKVAEPKITDSAVVWLLIVVEHLERQVLVAWLPDTSQP